MLQYYSHSLCLVFQSGLDFCFVFLDPAYLDLTCFFTDSFACLDSLSRFWTVHYLTIALHQFCLCGLHLGAVPHDSGYPAWTVTVKCFLISQHTAILSALCTTRWLKINVHIDSMSSQFIYMSQYHNLPQWPLQSVQHATPMVWMRNNSTHKKTFLE